MYISNEKNVKIRTPSGWQPFGGVLIDSNKKNGKQISTADFNIKVSDDHIIKTVLGDKKARQITLSDTIITQQGPKKVLSLSNTILNGSYEIVNAKSHYIYANGIVNHNCDEFAFVKPNIQETFWTAISPTLSTGGGCMIASTPNGDSNKFAEIWYTAIAQMREGNTTADDFHPMEIKWNDVPGRGEEFKQGVIKKEGLNHWLQEYECKFISSDNLLVDTNTLDRLNELVSAPYFTSQKHKIQFWEPVKANKQYIVAVDPATGTSKDYSVISIFDFPQLNQIAMYRSNSMSSPELYVILTDLLKAIEASGGSSYVSVENNGVGEGMISLYLTDSNFPKNATFISETTTKMGFTTTNKSKFMTCLVLKDLIENDEIGVRSPTLLKELKTYVRRGASYSGQVGSTDDCVSSLLIMIRIVEHLTKFDMSAFNLFYTNRHQRASNMVSLTRNDLREGMR